MTLNIKLNNIKRNCDNRCFFQMIFSRCAHNTINVQNVSPTNLTYDVDTGTSAFTCLTSSTTTLTKLSSSDNVWIAGATTYTLPITITTIRG